MDIKPPSQEEIEKALRARQSGNAEIESALEEFQTADTKYEAAKVPVNREKEGSGILNFLVKYSGGTLDRTQASYIVAAIAMLLIIFSLFLIFKQRGVPEPDPEDIIWIAS